MQKNQRNPLILLLSTMLVLSACSKKEEYADASVATTEKQGMADMAAPASAPVASSNPQDVPNILLSEQANPAEKNRQMVKTASIRFEVKDVYQTALQLEQLAAEFSGFVEQKDIQKEVEDVYNRNNNDGTLVIFEKVRPTASMVVRIPSDQTQRFVNTLPKFMLFLNAQSYEAKRYQLKLLEEKLNQQANSNPSSERKTADRLAAEIADLTRQEVQDRLSYSTIQLNFNQPATVHQTQDIQLNQIAKQDQHFFARLWQSIQLGAMGFLDFIVAAMLLWPLWIIVMLAVWFIWHKKKKHLRQRLNNTANPTDS